jgi:hypothetical protein
MNKQLSQVGDFVFSLAPPGFVPPGLILCGLIPPGLVPPGLVTLWPVHFRL